MPMEIERRFAVKSDDALPHIAGLESRHIRQVYFGAIWVETRLRIIDDNEAFITIKGQKESGAGLEFEYPVAIEEAREIMSLALHGGAPAIEKERYRIPHGGHVIELDFFRVPRDANLVIAEIEMSARDENIEPPSWFGPEITGNSRFANAFLAMYPPSEDEVATLFS